MWCNGKQYKVSKQPSHVKQHLMVEEKTIMIQFTNTSNCAKNMHSYTLKQKPRSLQRSTTLPKAYKQLMRQTAFRQAPKYVTASIMII